MAPLSPGLGCKTLQGNIEIHGHTAPTACRQLTNAPENLFPLQPSELAFSLEQVAGLLARWEMVVSCPAMLTQFLAAFLKRPEQCTGARLGTVTFLFSGSKFLLGLALRSVIKIHKGPHNPATAFAIYEPSDVLGEVILMERADMGGLGMVRPGGI